MWVPVDCIPDVKFTSIFIVLHRPSPHIRTLDVLWQRTSHFPQSENRNRILQITSDLIRKIIYVLEMSIPD